MKAQRVVSRLALVVFVAACARAQAQAPKSTPTTPARTTTQVAAPIVAPANPANLATDIDAAIASSALGNASIGISVVDVASGRILYEKNAGQKMNLASVTKVLTAGAALALLGPGFEFRTEAIAKPADVQGNVASLCLRGKGNPVLLTEQLLGIASQLRAGGVKRIKKLVIDNSYFDNQELPPHFDEQPKEDAYFRAPISATSINYNTFRVIVQGGSKAGAPAVATLWPPNDYVKISSAVTTIGKGRPQLAYQQHEEKGQLLLSVTGRVRAASFQAVRRRIPSPTAYFGATLANVFKTQGIKVDSKRVVGACPAGEPVLAAHESEPLAEVIKQLGKQSNNFVAETLVKVLGAETREAPGPGTFRDGLNAIRGYLTSVGLKDFYVGNGSGLFQASALSAKHVTTLLSGLANDFRIAPDFIASLSVAGVDGTLSHRMTESPARGVIRAKTGTLDAVSTLAGYAGTDARHLIAFAILINKVTPEQTDKARALQDAIGQILARR